MSVDSFDKIDMSLDDIIKLEKKKKVPVSAKAAGKGRALTAAQRKRAQKLKAAARDNIIKGGKGKGQKVKRAPLFRSNAAKRSEIASRSRPGMTRGGRTNAGKYRQPKKTQLPVHIETPRSLQTKRGLTGPKARGGHATIQDRLGTRANSAKMNQRQKRQQVTSRNRRGLSMSAGNGRKPRGRNTDNQGKFGRNNAQQIRRKQYNQQPRRPAGQQQSVRGRGVNNRRRQQTGYFAKSQTRRIGNTRGKGTGRRGRTGMAQRQVTLY